MNQKTTQIIIILIITIIGICHIIMAGTMPLLGDDLVYSRFDTYYDGSLIYFPRWVLRHWFYCNGRFPNLIAPLFLYFLPPWIIKCLTGIMVMLWLWAMLRVMHLTRSLFGSAVTLAIVVFAFTWWDTFTLYMIQMNYIWAIAMVLWWMVLMEKPITNKYKFCLLLAISILAGTSHEAASMPLLCGLCFYYILNGGLKHLDSFRLTALWVFAVATCFTVLSPGTIMRFGSDRLPDDTVWGLLVRSVPIALTAFALMVVCLWHIRRNLATAIRGTWAIYAIAALISAICVVLGGIVGRSGWFAQTYALIALCLLWRISYPKGFQLPRLASNTVAFLLFGVIIVHYIIWTGYQLKLSHEVSNVIDEYKKSSDGVVYADIWRRDMQPAYLLMKAQGVPDYDDVYVLSTLRNLSGDSVKVLTVLPTNLKQKQAELDDRQLKLECLTHVPPGQKSDTIPGCYGRRRVAIDNIDAIAIPVGSDSIYYLTRLPFNPTAAVR